VGRHPFDPVSLVCGVVAVTAGVVVLAGGSLIDEGLVLLPAGLIALGVALLLKVGQRPEPAPTPATAVGMPSDDPFRDNTLAEDPSTAPTDDFDRLFAPVDDVLATWDAKRAAAATTDVADDTATDDAATDDTATDDTATDDTALGPGPASSAEDGDEAGSGQGRELP
jgi:hypothetical protein